MNEKCQFSEHNLKPVWVIFFLLEKILSKINLKKERFILAWSLTEHTEGSNGVWVALNWGTKAFCSQEIERNKYWSSDSYSLFSFFFFFSIFNSIPWKWVFPPLLRSVSPRVIPSLNKLIVKMDPNSSTAYDMPIIQFICLKLNIY